MAEWMIIGSVLVAAIKFIQVMTKLQLTIERLNETITKQEVTVRELEKEVLLLTGQSNRNTTDINRLFEKFREDEK